MKLAIISDKGEIAHQAQTALQQLFGVLVPIKTQPDDDEEALLVVSGPVPPGDTEVYSPEDWGLLSTFLGGRGNLVILVEDEEDGLVVAMMYGRIFGKTPEVFTDRAHVNGRPVLAPQQRDTEVIDGTYDGHFHDMFLRFAASVVETGNGVEVTA